MSGAKQTIEAEPKSTQWHKRISQQHEISRARRAEDGHRIRIQKLLNPLNADIIAAYHDPTRTPSSKEDTKKTNAGEGFMSSVARLHPLGESANRRKDLGLPMTP